MVSRGFLELDRIILSVMVGVRECVLELMYSFLVYVSCGVSAIFEILCRFNKEYQLASTILCIPIDLLPFSYLPLPNLNVPSILLQ